MAKQPKLPKRLFKDKDVVHVYQHDRESKMSMKQMSRDHLDVLQNIEFALVTLAREDRSIDDRMVDAALREEMQRGEAGEDTSPQVEMLCELLQTIRSNSRRRLGRALAGRLTHGTRLGPQALAPPPGREGLSSVRVAICPIGFRSAAAARSLRHAISHRMMDPC